MLKDHLSGILAVDPAAPAIEHDDKWYSWGDFSAAIAAIDAELARAGIGMEGRVGILIRNRPAQLAAILAVLTTDRCMVTLNPLLPTDKLLADLDGLAAPIVIGEPADLAKPGVLDTLRAKGSAVLEIASDMSALRMLPGYEKPTGTDLRATEPGVAIEMLTSGTTGTPKRIPLSRQAFADSFAGAMFYERDRSDDNTPKLRSGTVLLSNPLTHIGGVYTVLTAMLGGRKGCLLEKFSVEGFHRAVVRHRPKVAGAVPAALRMILDANIPREDLASLVALRTGTAPLDPAVADEFLERYDIPVLQNYGATEFAGAVAGWTLRDFRTFWKDKRGSTGRAHADVEMRVIDAESGAEMPAGQEGVLELRAAQMGDAKRWYRTTDRGMIDSDGFLFIHGRADNAINRGGFKVHPDDVVKALEQHPSVREAVVVGIRDRRLGEVPAAAIMLKSGVTPLAEGELAAFAKARLLPYQVPAIFRIVDDVPRTPSMKPATPLVRKLFEEDAAAR